MPVYDFRKAEKELYNPKPIPTQIEVPAMPFIMVDGEGDPNNNESFGEAVELLYSLSYAIKMSKMKGLQPEGYFDFVVPPLEGHWWVEDGVFSFTDRENWKWTVMIRQPDFVTPDVFKQACATVTLKKPALPAARARFQSFTEGLCVQMMHNGPYATEPETIARMDVFMEANQLVNAMSLERKHHEIYLSDPRKTAPEAMKTILRHPVERALAR